MMREISTPSREARTGSKTHQERTILQRAALWLARSAERDSRREYQTIQQSSGRFRGGEAAKESEIRLARSLADLEAVNVRKPYIKLVKVERTMLNSRQSKA
jgi:hypothetical protein